MARPSSKKLSAQSSLRLYLLGSFRIERDSQPIRLPRRKVESLLAYLVLHPEPHPREKLAALFWGDFPDAQALHSLRTSLAVLREHLGDEIIFSEHDTLQVNPNAPFWIDTREFERIAKNESLIDDLQLAIDLYRGDLLADFYDDWILPERERYRNLYLDALLRLTQDLRSQSEYERAIEFAQKAIAADPGKERAYQHLMFCYLMIGKKDAALKEYERCARVLRDELDVEPTQETTALYHWIKQSAESKPLEARITNLPIPVSSFIGRKNETANVKRSISENRLITLTGAGGSGKTRLAIQAATDLIDLFKDGVWWVELAPLTDELLVPQAIAKALGVHEAQGETLSETLANFLRGKQLLLLLDNCEHLIASCAQIAATFLSAARDVKILATSREPLGILGEKIFPVPTLALPNAARLSLTDLLMEYESIRLFVERAAAVNPRFSLTPQNAITVAQICQQLDGIPLAIELAAVRARVLSVEHIAERLNNRFNLLTSGNRGALPRQQTLRATIDWSYDLLTDSEKKLFQQLAVFSGGFTLEAAVAVSVENGLEQTVVQDLVLRLVDKSLVIVDSQNGKTRYRMLETIQQYAIAKLKEIKEEETLRSCHFDFFLTLAEKAEPYLTSANREEWLDTLEAEYDNLRAALEWSRADLARSEKLLRLAGALFGFWNNRGYLSEGRSWLTEALDRTDPAVISPARAKGLYGVAFLARSQGDVDLARALHAQSVNLWRELGAASKHGLAHALVAQGQVEQDQGNPVVACALIAEAVALFREMGDPWGLAYALNQLGFATRDTEDFDKARAVLEEAVSIWRELGDEGGLAVAVMYLGLVAYRRGDYAAAILLFEDTVKMQQKSRRKSGLAFAITNLGLMALNLGDYARAKSCFDQSVLLFRELGIKYGIAISLLFFGMLAMFQDNDAEAQSFFTESLRLAREVGPIWCRGGCLAGLAGVAAVRGQFRRAAQLWGAAETQIARAASFFDANDRRLYERTVVHAHTQLGEQAFETARAEGRAMSSEQAIKYALQPE